MVTLACEEETWSLPRALLSLFLCPVTTCLQKPCQDQSLEQLRSCQRPTKIHANNYNLKEQKWFFHLCNTDIYIYNITGVLETWATKKLMRCLWNSNNWKKKVGWVKRIKKEEEKLGNRKRKIKKQANKRKNGKNNEENEQTKRHVKWRATKNKFKQEISFVITKSK